MKRFIQFILLIALCLPFRVGSAQVDLFGKVKEKAEEKANEEIDKTLDGDQEEGNDENQDQNDNEQPADQQKESQSDEPATTTHADSTAKIKMYANYDFVAGEHILFEDNFASDMDGEFPAHWDLKSGQAIVNKQAGKSAFLMTDGNYCVVMPLMKTEKYLSTEFTIEFDWYSMEGAYGVMVGFEDEEGQSGELAFNAEGVSANFPEKDLFGSYPESDQFANNFNKWHHCAIAFKNNQIKVYVDANRVIVVPNTKLQPVTMNFHGIGNTEFPIIFSNVKIAEGGKMNMLDKIMTDGRIITHGILFDVNSSTIKPESMGVINQIYELMKSNPDLKFEIGGHTDSDGSDESNLKLSQARAESVKTQLVSMGIDPSRLTTKGYGESKPIDNNTTPEGKANNRRVEFVKM